MGEAKTKTKANVKRARGRARVEPAPALPASVDVLLNRRQVAFAIGTSLRNLTTLIGTKRFPIADMRHDNGSPRWRTSTVQAWIAGKTGVSDGVGAKAAD